MSLTVVLRWGSSLLMSLDCPITSVFLLVAWAPATRAKRPSAAAMLPSSPAAPARNPRRVIRPSRSIRARPSTVTPSCRFSFPSSGPPFSPECWRLAGTPPGTSRHVLREVAPGSHGVCGAPPSRCPAHRQRSAAAGATATHRRARLSPAMARVNAEPGRILAEGPRAVSHAEARRRRSVGGVCRAGRKRSCQPAGMRRCTRPPPGGRPPTGNRHSHNRHEEGPEEFNGRDHGVSEPPTESRRLQPQERRRALHDPRGRTSRNDRQAPFEERRKVGEHGGADQHSRDHGRRCRDRVQRVVQPRDIIGQDLQQRRRGEGVERLRDVRPTRTPAPARGSRPARRRSRPRAGQTPGSHRPR